MDVAGRPAEKDVGSSEGQRTSWAQFVSGTGRKPTLAMEVPRNERMTIVLVDVLEGMKMKKEEEEDTIEDEDEEKKRKSVSQDEDEDEQEDERTLVLDPKTKRGHVEEVLHLKQKRGHWLRRGAGERLRQDWG